MQLFGDLQAWSSKTWLSKIDTVDWQNPAPVPGSGPRSRPGPATAAAQRTVATNGPDPDPGPDPGTGAGFCQSTVYLRSYI